MRIASALLVGLCAAGAAACSPFGHGAFHCASDTDCANGATLGTCELGVGFCSFTDPACPSGRRFGESSGGDSGACVDTTNVLPDAPPIDGAGSGSGSGSDGGDLTGCYGTGLLVVCPTQPLANTATLTGGPVDTNPGSPACMDLRPPGATDVCAIGGMGVTVSGATIRATGARPLVIVSDGDVKIDAPIDVSSHRDLATGETLGAGSTRATATCTAGTADPGDGGAGGSFGTVGATGGISAPMSRAQTAPAAVAPTSVTVGCAGQRGSMGDGNGGPAGAAGASGGIVALIATGTIAITQPIDASGMGGGAGAVGSRGAGGGGGGPGGLILLDAPAITTSADVYANGGAGGEGNGGNVGDPGCIGGESTSASDVAAANCGVMAPQDTGGDNGLGSTRTATPTIGGDGGGTSGGYGGGGGGGGGLGVILVYAANFSGDAHLSPAPTPH